MMLKATEKTSKGGILSNWSIGKRIIAGFLVVSAMTAVAGVTGILEIGSIGRAADRISYEEAPLADASMEMIISLISGRDAMGEYMNASTAISRTDGSALKEFEDEFYRTVKDFDGFATIMREGGEYQGVVAIATDNEELLKAIKEAEGVHDEKFQPAVAELIQAGKEIVRQKAVLDEHMGEMEALYNEVKSDAHVLEEKLDATVDSKSTGLSADARRILDRDIPLVDAAMEMAASLSAMRLPLEEIAQATQLKEVAELQREYSQAIEEFDQWNTAILNGGVIDGNRIYASTDREVLAMVREMDENHAEFEAVADTLIIAQLEMIRLTAAQHEAMKNLDESSVVVEELLEKVEELAGAEMADAMSSADSAQVSATVILVSVTVIAVAIGIIIGLFIGRSVTRPVDKMIAVLKDIEEGEGDLTKRLNIESNDEIGVMSRLFDSFLAKTQDLLKNIGLSSEQVGNASTQISSASEQLAAGAEEQQSQLSEVATTMEQMSAMILEASKNANETRQNAQTTGDTAQQGRDVVSKTVSGFETVANTVEQAAQQIQELSKRSVEIGNVIQVIDDIADQTNLLALNANIEAARAGEAGRGFAVVADEVRKLAERTVSATSEIGKMIESIQGDIQNAVSSMETIQEQSREGLGLVAESDRSLQEISESITGVVSAVEQIATSTNEQSSGAEEISKNIEGVSTVAKQSASSAQELAASAEELNKEVLSLNELIGQFKVE